MSKKVTRALFLLLIALMLLMLSTSCPLFPTEATLTILVSGEGETVPSAGAHKFSKNETVQLGADPVAGWDFSEWQGDVADPNSPVTSIVMSEDKTVEAIFTEILSEIEEIIARIDPSVPDTLRFVEDLIPLVEGYLDEFLDLLVEEEDYLKRWASAFALQRSALDESTLNELEEYLDDPDPTIRALMSVAFLRNDDDKGKEPLEDLLGNDEVSLIIAPVIVKPCDTPLFAHNMMTSMSSFSMRLFEERTFGFAMPVKQRQPQTTRKNELLIFDVLSFQRNPLSSSVRFT